MKKIGFLVMAVFLTAILGSCSDKRGASPKAEGEAQGKVEAKVVATVNGAPITEYDVTQIQRRVPHGETIVPKNILDTLVRNELVYQKSIELGLDKNPVYRKKLDEVEAQVREYQRQEMAVLFREYVRKKVTVTDSEAQDYFNKNSKRIQTQYHILQIYHRGAEAEIDKAYKDIKAGTPFEKVAAKRFPKLPKGMQPPWDVGYLHWFQVPPAWQDTVDRLKPGQVSDIIKGPGERFWVIKMVDRKVDPKVTFAAEKERVVDILRMEKASALYDSMLAEMKTKAKIAYPK